MSQYVITLQNRASGEIFTVQARNYSGRTIRHIHREVLKQYPGCFIRKSIRK